MSRKAELRACLRSDFILMKDTVAYNDNSDLKYNKQIKNLHVPKEIMVDTKPVSINHKTQKGIMKSIKMFEKPQLCYYEDEISSIKNDEMKKSSNVNINAIIQKTDISNINDKPEWVIKIKEFLIKLQNVQTNQNGSISESEKLNDSDVNKSKRKYSKSSDRSESPPCKKITSNLGSSKQALLTSNLKFKPKCDVEYSNLRDTLKNIFRKSEKLERKISENTDESEKSMATFREIEQMKIQMNELWKALDNISSEKKQEAKLRIEQTGKNEEWKPKDLQDPLPGSEASKAKSRVDNPSKNLPKENSNSVEKAMSKGVKTATSLYLKAKNFYDGGNLWCQTCNTLHRDIHEFSQHLHAHYHAETSNPRESTAVPDKSTIHLESAPARGDEFFKPLKAYHCSLCDCLLKDSCVLEKHFTSPDHNAKFKTFIASHTDYEVPYLTQKMTVLLRREMSKNERSVGNKPVDVIIID